MVGTAALSLVKFARTCTSTTSRALLNFKVIGQRSRLNEFLVFFCMHNAAATRGGYLALSKAWWSCDVFGCWGRYDANDQHGFKRWKANFRCALNSLPDVEQVLEKSGMKSSDPYKVYRLLDPITHRSTLRWYFDRCHRNECIRLPEIVNWSWNFPDNWNLTVIEIDTDSLVTW